MRTFIAHIGQEEISIEADSIARAAYLIAKTRFPKTTHVYRVTGAGGKGGWFQAYGDLDNAVGQKFRVEESK